MKMLFDPVPVKIHKSLPTPLKNPRDSSISRLEAISKRGFLRVGYFKDSLPFAFTNSEGTLVGFDIEMAHLLAKALDVSLEFVRIDREKVAVLLNDGYCDIVMSGVAITSVRLREMAFSLPYMDNTVGFIVKDHRRDEFKTLQSIQSLEAPRIGIPNSPHFIAKVQKILPHVMLVPLNSPREFFKRQDLDAFIFTAEAGSAWTLIYPEYAVVVPQPESIKAPLAYPIAQNDQRMINFINAWIGLRMKDKTIEKLFDHWVLGHGADKKEPRWSIIRNVLHWVD
jgi:ABC-type amino acid transport substrate-binding protein